MNPDVELLREYARTGSESAFATLVRKYPGLVYSVALREVRSPHIAEEITQSVFILLASKAKTFDENVVIPGWLCRAARNLAADWRKKEQRRVRRETDAHMSTVDSANASADWDELAPLLEAGMSKLRQVEHDAVVLRFYTGRELSEIGDIMGISADAARMRVNRGLERLRTFFAAKGIPISVAALSTALAAHSVHAAPVSLAAATLAASASAVSVTQPALSFVKIMAMTTLEKAVGVAALVIAVSVFTVQHWKAATAGAESATISQQITVLQNRKSAAEQGIDEFRQELAALKAQERSAEGEHSEVLKLRSQVAMLQRERDSKRPADEPMSAAAAALVDRVQLLKARFQQWPGKPTPELILLAEKDWDSEAAKTELQTEEDIRKAMSELRLRARQNFAEQIKQAYEQFLKGNNNVPPTAPEMLRPFLQPEAASLLGGYEIAKPRSVRPPGTKPESPPAEMWAMVEKGNFTPEGRPIQDGTNLSDPKHDSYVVICRTGPYWYNAAPTAPPNSP